MEQNKVYRLSKIEEVKRGIDYGYESKPILILNKSFLKEAVIILAAIAAFTALVYVAGMVTPLKPWM